MADVTVEQLTEALTGFRLYGRYDSTTGHHAIPQEVLPFTVAEPDKVASILLDNILSALAARDPAIVSVRLTRDDALRLEGWINAHRPPGDWEPGFLSRALTAIDKATSTTP